MSSVTAAPPESGAVIAAQGPAGAHEMTGPSALTDDWSRFWHLTYNIARNEFKLRFFGSALGYVWQLVRPLLLFGVLYVFFTVVAHVGQGGVPSNRYYGAQLLGSIVLFTFFAEATIGSVRSVVDRENLVRKIQFPRLVIPLSTVTLALFNLGLNLVVVLIFSLASGVHPRATWVQIPLILAMLLVLALGVSMLLSALFVPFRDIQPIWDVITQILFYASPVIIPIDQVRTHLIHHQLLLKLYMLNPLAVVLQQFRHAVVNPHTPSAAAVAGWGPVIGAIVLTVFLFGLGFWYFNRSAPLIAENL